MEPLIINLAPTGIGSSSTYSPHVPVSPQKIADDVACCASLGVSMVHLHARNPDGTPSNESSIYSEIISSVRAQTPEIVIITSLSGRRVSEIECRTASLYLEGNVKPDMASLTLGSMNFSTETSVNTPKTIMRLAQIMKECGIKPELEVFDLGMVNVAKILIDKGLIEPPFYFNVLLGNPGTAQATLLHLSAIINDLPQQSFWSLAGIGRFQTKANALGVVMGNGVRVGLEDNLWFDDARLQLASNEQLVRRVAAQANAIGRPIALAREVRAMLGLRRAE